ncbi:MAG: zinc-binding alcohol dehydrogenase [Lentisphaeria bacterium]|nr:zinc-binding alcohol dehydrogenase [Lentisphaeria bacterium]
MFIKKIVFPEKEKAQLIDVEINDKLQPDELLVKYDYSAISAGTELANFLHLPNTQENFPKYPGYSASGHVIETGRKVSDFTIGDRVVLNWGCHVSHLIRTPEQAIMSNVKHPGFKGVVKIENDSVSGIEAAFTHIASFPLLAVRKLKINIGESAMIAGCGLLGLIAIQFAKLSGAYPVMALDFSPERRELAKQMGADIVFDPSDADMVQKIKDATRGCGPDVVVEVTGKALALQQALEYINYEGRITLLGCTRVSDVNIDYYKYVHRRGITMIGAHTMTRPHLDNRENAWTEKNDYRVILDLLGAGRLSFKPLINRLVSPADAHEVYTMLATGKNPPLGVVFDWSLLD